MLFSLLVVFLLIVMNAFYVAAEFAAVSVSLPRLKQLADEGSVSAGRLIPIISSGASIDRYVAACQIGITLSSLVLGAYGQMAFSRILSPVFATWGGMDSDTAQGTVAVIVLIGLTAFQMILGELLPKSISLQFPVKIALATVKPMELSIRLLYPFIQLLNGSGLLILKLIGVPQTSHRHVHSADEMGLLFSESHEGGLIAAEEHERLEQALQLENRKVAEIMIPRSQIKALDVNSDYESVLRVMGEHPYTRWPVYEGSIDHIVGITHARDVARLALDPSKRFDLRKVIRQPLVVHEGMAADDLLSIMRIEHKQLAIVIDEFGIPVGLVGISDVLDEFIGDIHEGNASETESVQVLKDGRVRLPGTFRLDEASRWIGKKWESSKTLTVAGKVLESVGALPQPGAQVKIDGVEVEVDRVSELAIESILVRPLKTRKQAVEHV